MYVGRSRHAWPLEGAERVDCVSVDLGETVLAASMGKDILLFDLLVRASFLFVVSLFIVVWLQAGVLRARLSGHTAAVAAVAFSCTQPHLLFSAGEDRTVMVRAC